MEEKGKTQTEALGLDDGGRGWEKTQRNRTTTGGVEPMDIWTCQKADDLKKKKSNLAGEVCC